MIGPSISVLSLWLHAMHVEDPQTSDPLPRPEDLWALHNWTWELSIILPLAVGGLLYLFGAKRRRGAWLLRWRHLAFVTGWSFLTFALVSPLHRLGDALFSAHMLQHEFLILLAAPLIAAAHCSVTFLYAFPQQWRRVIGGEIARFERHPAISLLSAPLLAWILHAVALWVWHIPSLYEATVRSDLIHALQHLSFFLSALVFWAALFGAGRSTMSYGAATVYTFGTAVHCSALGALLTFSTVVWYPIYEGRTMIWHLTPLQDQQLGGLLMWIPSGVVFIAIGIALFAKWLKSSEERLVHTSLASTPAHKEAS